MVELIVGLHPFGPDMVVKNLQSTVSTPSWESNCYSTLPLLERPGTFQACGNQRLSRGRECPRNPVSQAPRRCLPRAECTSSAQAPWVSS